MFEASNDLAMYLSPGERIVWEGKGRRALSSASIGGIPFLVIFGAVAGMMLIIFATVGPERGSSQALVVILPIVFLAVGLGVGIPLLVLGRQSGNARYVVTSASAMIVSENRWTGKRVTVIPLKSVPQVSLTENRDGTGTLMFGQNPFMINSRYAGGWWTASMPAFWNIERPLEVYQLIRKQMTAE